MAFNMASSGKTFEVFPTFSRFASAAASTVSSLIGSARSSVIGPQSKTRARQQRSAFGTLLSAVVMLIAVGGMLPQAAVAGSMHTMQALADGASWAQSDARFNNSLWVRSSWDGGLTFAESASGVALDPWNVLMTGHQAHSGSLFATEWIVGTGSNWLTDPGDVYSTTDIVIHPLWNGTIFSQTVDMSILHFPGGIPGMDSLNFAGTAIGQQLNGAGFGTPAAGGAYIPDDELERAHNWYVDGYGSAGGTVSTNYLRNRFLPLSFRNDPMAGGMTGGDSGMGVFDATGNLVGLGVGIGGTPPGYGFDSFALRTDLFWDSWIVPNMIVPEPGTISLLAFAALALLRRRRSLVN